VPELMTTAAPLLSTSGLRRSFGAVRAVDGVDLRVASHTITALIGPNGAGKTTLFDILTGFDRAHAGTVRFAGDRIERRAGWDIARRGLVRTFQTPRPFASLTVLDNLVVGSRAHPGERLLSLLTRPRAVKARERALIAQADEVLDLVGLTGQRDQRAGALSGGQGKLLELARALMLSPQLLLLDEPVAGVNPKLAEEILARILRLRDQGITFLIIEHDMDFVMAAAERVVVMAEGRVISQGTPDEVRRDRRVIDAYLGRGGERD
jgi:branched-chain amino acid transport system ATP-binding protein